VKHLFFFIILLLFGNSFSQETSFKTFSVREGLAQSQVFSIVQDSKGYLWMATQGGGVCRFDGSEFYTYTISDGVISNTVNTLLVSNNLIYIGTNKGVSVFDVNKNQVIKSVSSNSAVSFIKIIEDEVVVANQTNLFKLSKDSLVPFNRNLDFESSRIESSFYYKSKFWVTSTKGTVCANNPSLSFEKVHSKVTSHYTKALVFEKSILLGTYGNGLLVLKDEGNDLGYIKDTLEMFNEMIITSLYQDSKENVWVGTQRKGIFKYDYKDKKWEQFGENEGLSNDHVKCVFEDTWNQIWIGTSGGGVNRYTGSQFLHYTENSGLNGDYIFSVLNSSREELWVGTSGGGVMKINDTSNVVFNSKNGFFDVKVKSLFEDSRGLVWIGTEGKGVSVYYHRNLVKSKLDLPVLELDTMLSFYDGIRFPSTLWVKAFAENKKGEVFMSTSGGGLVKARVLIDTFPIVSFRKIKIKNEQELSLRISDMFFDSHDQMILATSDMGVGFLKNGVLQYFNRSNSSVPNKINTIEEGLNGRVWFGSDLGIGYIINDSISIYNKSNGLASNNIYQLQIDHKGFIWVGHEKGLDRVELLKNGEIEVVHFGAEEGFIGIETSLNASHKDLKNNLWFGTVNGLSVYRPKEILKSENPPQIYFSSIKVFYDSLSFESVQLEYHENSLSFSFGAIFLPNPKKIKFQWKLEGLSKEWSAPSSASSIIYSNLNPGKYIFYVRAGYGDNWSDPITFEFYISKPYWEEIWFRLMVWGGGALLIFLIIFVVIYRFRQRNKEVNKQLEMEKSLIELEQKALRLQMNPHFIFNSLNTIQHLIIEKDEKSAKYYLSKFAKLMRQILENSREKLISIDDEVMTLENYLIIEKFSREDFDYIINIEDEIDTEEEILPPMMIQPFVENAIIHGLKGLKNRKGLIKITFKLIDDYLQFEVEDNGQGREEAENQKSQIANYHRSTALKVTQERLDNLNKSLDFKSFEIIDLKGDAGVPLGTRIVLRVKL
jgi:ligand-binding sensor domain-containing protein